MTYNYGRITPYAYWADEVAYNPDAEMYTKEELREAKEQGDNSHIEPPSYDQLTEHLDENYAEMHEDLVSAFAEYIHVHWFEYIDDRNEGVTNAEFVASVIAVVTAPARKASLEKS